VAEIVSPPRHEKAYVVARGAARLRGLMGLMIGVDREAQRERGDEALTATVEHGDGAHRPISLAT
jgi:hypothetical protein